MSSLGLSGSLLEREKTEQIRPGKSADWRDLSCGRVAVSKLEAPLLFPEPDVLRSNFVGLLYWNNCQAARRKEGRLLVPNETRRNPGGT